MCCDRAINPDAIDNGVNAFAFEIGTRMRHGDWEAASALIAEVSFESDDLIASGILHCAAAHGAPSEILTQLVMNKGFDVNHVFEYYTPLIGAIRGSHYETGKSLVELGANVNLGVVASSRSYTQSPLHAAIVRYSRNMCLLLLKHGASTTAKDIHGYSPLIAAIKMGQSEIAEDIIKFNADVNARVQKDETTPMIRAARRNLPIVCQRLLENGANVNRCR